MNNFTKETYEMKKEILKFSEKITKNLSKPESKFVKNIEYGIFNSFKVFIIFV